MKSAATRPSAQPAAVPGSAPAQVEPPSSPPLIQASAPSSPASPSGLPLVQAALHLGLRYNVLRVDAQTGKSREVDPDTNFQDGDCLAVRFTPNRGGYLYVFNSGTTGAWQPLLPSPDMPDESVTVSAAVPTLFPRNYCLQISPPKGSERLLIVLTGIEEDFQKLSEAIRKSLHPREDAPPAAAPPPRPGAKEGTLLALNLLGTEIERLQGTQMASRDLVIQKLTAAESGDDPPNSVYVVKAASSPADRLILEIYLRHE